MSCLALRTPVLARDERAFTGAAVPSLQWPLGGKPSLLASGSLETRCAQTVDAAFPQLRRGFQRLEANLSLRHASSRYIRHGLRGLAERSMDGAAGNPPRSAPHESRSPPTANLRSGRFVRAQARWVAARVPWSEGSPRSPKQQDWRMCNHHLRQSDTVKEISRANFLIESPLETIFDLRI